MVPACSATSSRPEPSPQGETAMGWLSPVATSAVAIAVAGAHRDEAFAACRHLIEEVKRRVPIWKRETYADGSQAWVDPTRTVQAVTA